MGVRQRRSWRFPLVADKRAERCPAGSWPRCVGLPGFAVSGLPGGVSRGYSGRCARGGSVVRFLPRAALYEVGEDGADGGGFFDAGHDP